LITLILKVIVFDKGCPSAIIISTVWIPISANAVGLINIYPTGLIETTEVGKGLVIPANE
jgi:hypothetical protein